MFLFDSKSFPAVAVTQFACQRGELTIRGTQYRPEGENLPVAIVCHGFMAVDTASAKSTMPSPWNI